mgnify:CR=1 FL=1|jgi:hypothetical protein
MNIKEALSILVKEYEIPLESGLFSKNKQKLRYMLIYILNVDLRLKYDEIKQYINIPCSYLYTSKQKVVKILIGNSNDLCLYLAMRTRLFNLIDKKIM